MYVSFKIFENKILKMIFVPKMDENGEWTMSRKQKFHTFYCSSNIIDD